MSSLSYSTSAHFSSLLSLSLSENIRRYKEGKKQPGSYKHGAILSTKKPLAGAERGLDWNMRPIDASRMADRLPYALLKVLDDQVSRPHLIGRAKGERKKERKAE